MAACVSAGPDRTGAPKADPERADVSPTINESWLNTSGPAAAGRLERDGREVFEARDAILAALKLQPGQSVADVGAGSGLFTRLFSEAVGPRGRVYAVDISKPLLEYIDAEAQKAKLDNIETILGTARSSELPAGSVDLVFVSDSYHHFEYPQAMLESMRAALRPRGRMVIIDFKRIDGESSEWIIEHVRAGESTVVAEIEAAGFKRVERLTLEALEENYFVVFEKTDQD